MKISRFLSSPQPYLDQIDRLHIKYARRNALHDVTQDDVSLATVCLRREAFANLLADTVGAGKYSLSPAQTRTVCVGDRTRLLYAFTITDRIVHGVVATAVNECMQPRMTPQLYSYRRGTHWLKGIADFARYVRAHRRTRPDPKQRGLYILRRDVHKYTDSIPVHGRSELWPILSDIVDVDPARSEIDKLHWQLLQKVVRPDVCGEDGLASTNLYGVPTGSAISTTLFNMYLLDLDEALRAVPGGFYARYSDDILFAHPDAEVTALVAKRINDLLRARDLRTNEDKDENLYFNGAARPSPHSGHWRGTNVLTFLGCEIAFDGTIALKARKVRDLLADLKRRAERSMGALNDKRSETIGPVLCSVVNDALNPASAFHHKAAPFLRSAVTCRRQLRQIDYDIARMLASLLSNRPGVKAFRAIPYRTLRENWNLTSLLHTRNVGWRAAHRTRE